MLIIHLLCASATIQVNLLTYNNEIVCLSLCMLPAELKFSAAAKRHVKSIKLTGWICSMYSLGPGPTLLGHPF